MAKDNDFGDLTVRLGLPTLGVTRLGRMRSVSVGHLAKVADRSTVNDPQDVDPVLIRDDPVEDREWVPPDRQTTDICNVGWYA